MAAAVRLRSGIHPSTIRAAGPATARCQPSCIRGNAVLTDTRTTIADESRQAEPADRSDLVRRAECGDREAWAELVGRYTGLLWSVARSYRLGPEDSADVVQTCWLRLAGNLGRIRDGAAVGGWLATTARRECLRLLRTRAREHLSDLDEAAQWPAEEPTPEDRVAERDRDQRLLAAVRRLPERDQRLLRVLAASPPPSYAEVAAALDMPIGAIGPTRARCLARLRRELSRTL